jgi:hypothetical protein
MRRKLTFALFVPTEEEARKRTLKFFAHLANLTVDSIEPYYGGGYQVWISYDEEKAK